MELICYFKFRTVFQFITKYPLNIRRKHFVNLSTTPTPTSLPSHYHTPHTPPPHSLGYEHLPKYRARPRPLPVATRHLLRRRARIIVLTSRTLRRTPALLALLLLIEHDAKDIVRKLRELQDHATELILRRVSEHVTYP